jgi:hypothetical protein
MYERLVGKVRRRIQKRLVVSNNWVIIISGRFVLAGGIDKLTGAKNKAKWSMEQAVDWCDQPAATRPKSWTLAWFNVCICCAADEKGNMAKAKANKSH